MKRCRSNTSLPSSPSSTVSSSSSTSIVVDQEEIIIDSVNLHNQPTTHPPPNAMSMSKSIKTINANTNKRARTGKRTNNGGGGRNGSQRQKKSRNNNNAVTPISNNSDAPDAVNATTTNAGNSKGGRSSIYRGVTRHRWTGRFEAHLWDKSCWNSVQNKKGRQVYLGAYDSEEDAARTYDLAALKYWGPDTILNFPVENYTKEVEEMQNVSREEYLASLRRRSSGFSRGVSKYRGVARHHHNGRWEARIGRVLGNQYLYLGTFSSQEEAAIAYDLAAIEYRGANAVTNFDISNYLGHEGKKKDNIMSIDQLRQKQPQNPNNSSSNNIESKPLLLEQSTQQLPPSPSLPPESQTQGIEQLADHSATPSPSPSPSPTTIHENHIESSYLVNNPSVLAMDDVPKQAPDHQLWNFCSENIDFDFDFDLDFDVDSFLVPHIPMDEEGNLLDLFADPVFEDNIDMIFQGSEATLSSSNLNDTDGIIQQDNTDVSVDNIAASDNSTKDEEEEKMDKFSSFTTLSPLYVSSSTTTSSMICQL